MYGSFYMFRHYIAILKEQPDYYVFIIVTEA
jgi:hypothetical protein